ncbi:MAG: hypothetical protein U9P71_05460 [Campylobacterota bacterium]|nr:hypothetical protein [Campylobacterota bacterium]
MASDEVLFIINEDRQLLFDGTTFKDIPSKKTAAYHSAAVLPASIIRTHGFKAPQDTSPEKLEIQAEMSIYEDGGLDPEVDFKIASLTIPLEHEESLYVESYAVEEDTLHKQFDAVAKKSGQIDTIFPAALSYSALYAFEKLKKKNDIFIHFDDNNAYAVIFKEGQYISTRAITTLNDIATKLGIEVSKVREYLAKKGVESDLYTPDEFLHMTDIQDELSKVVERIAHAISHKRGIFRLESIDRFFIDFEGSNIPGFLELFNSYDYEESSKEVLNVFQSVEVGNRHHALQALYALASSQEKLTAVNLSIYERKPSFFKTHAGQFSLVIIASILLAVAYPIYATLELEKLNERHYQLQSDVSKMEKLTLKLRLKLKQERQKRDELKEQKATAVAKIEGYGHTLDAVKLFDTETLNRQKMMKDVNNAMRQFALSSKYLEQNSSASMKVQIITKYEERDNIAKFMKQLIAKGYAYVHTKKIERDDNLYESLVEIRP